jgi:acyl carrier protein
MGMEIVEELRTFILQELAGEPSSEPLDLHEDLLAAGLIDSLGVVKLAEFIHGTYGILITDEDVVPENFRSLDSLARFIRGRLPA